VVLFTFDSTKGSLLIDPRVEKLSVIHGVGASISIRSLERENLYISTQFLGEPPDKMKKNF